MHPNPGRRGVSSCGWVFEEKYDGPTFEEKYDGPTREWLKVKIRQLIQRALVRDNHEARFVIVGLDVPLAGACSLLLAARIGRRLRYVGRVECDVSRRIVPELRERLRVQATAACDGVENGRGIVWVEPGAVAEIQFNELMLGRLRDPVLRAVHLPRP